MNRSRRLVLGLLLMGCASAPDPAADDEHVAFEGVTAFPESELRAIVAPDLSRTTANGDEVVLEDAIFRLSHRYRRDGYVDVEVRARREGRKIVFSVFEGSPVTVGRVHFVGNREFKDRELSPLVPRGLLGGEAPYSPELAAAVRAGILDAYLGRGYLDATVKLRESRSPDDPLHIHLTFEIAEGIAYSVTGLRGLPDDPALEELVRSVYTQPYSPALRERMEIGLARFYRERGHPFATALVRPDADPASGEVTLNIDILRGEEVRLGEIVVTGNRWTRESFVESRSDLEEKSLFRASDFRKAEERLMDTGIFKSVRVSLGDPQEEEEPGVREVNVVVEEKEVGEASLRAGYGSFEGPRLGGDIRGVNLWGGAELFQVGGFVSRAGYRVDTGMTVPYIAGTELRLGLAAHYEDREYPSYEATSRGTVASASYVLAEPLTVTGGVRRVIIDTDDVDPSVPPGDRLDFDYMSLFFSPSFDLRDSPVLPTRGALIIGEAAWAPAVDFSDIAFFNVAGRFRYWMPLPAGLVFATELQAGYIKPLASTETIPISLRYFAGGTTTVRGFEFESIGPKVDGEPTGGEVYGALQMELRFPVWGGLHGAVFTDRGGVWFHREDIDLDETRYSVGLGLRFYTPAGAVALDVGWNPSREEDEEAVEPHFSIGFPF